MTTRELNTAIDQGSSLKLITQAYSELASIRLKKIRDEVERNRQFYDDLTYVYSIVIKTLNNSVSVLSNKIRIQILFDKTKTLLFRVFIKIQLSAKSLPHSLNSQLTRSLSRFLKSLFHCSINFVILKKNRKPAYQG